MIKKLHLSVEALAIVLLLGHSAFQASAGAVYNFAEKLIADGDIDANGWPVSAKATTGDFNGISGTRLFDGITYRASSGSYDDRWLVNLYTHGVGNVYAQLSASAGFRSNKNFILRSYRIHRGSYWRQDGRDPKQWKIYGIPDGASTDSSRWVLLAEQTTDYTYPTFAANETNEFVVTATGDALTGFRGFRFVPTSSSFYAQNVKDGKKTNAYDIDMREVEFFVEEVDAPARGPMRIYEYLTDRGGSASPYYESQNMYKDLDYWSSFNGKRTPPQEATHRCLGYMGKEGGCWVGLNIPASAPERYAGDSLYLVYYRIYTLYAGGNETNRVPTAWSVQVATGENELTTADERTGQQWGSIGFFDSYINYRSFFLTTPTPFDHFRFVPTDSWALSVEGKSGDQINVGWAELDLYVASVNPKGTMRVYSSKRGGSGFNPEADTLVNYATTLTAPSIASVSNENFKVTGYYLEYFDYSSGRWQLKPGSYSESLSYDYTPDSEKSERIIWIVSDELIGARITVEANALKGHETVSGFGAYAIGSVVTLAASASTDDLTASGSDTNRYHSTFLRWEGDIGGLDIDVTSPSIEITVDRSRVLRPVFVRDWFLFDYDLANEGGSGTSARIKDGNWEFVVRNYSTDTRTIRLARDGWLSGSGKLDFSTGKVYRAGDTNRYILRAFEDYMMGVRSDSPTEKRVKLTELLLPEELEEMGEGAFRTQEALVKLVMNCPKMKVLNACAFTRDTALSEVHLNLPSLVDIKSSYAFFNVILTNSNASTWNLNAVTNLGVQTFQVEMGPASQQIPYSAGCLSLPSVQLLADRVFQNTRAFGEIHLGTTNHVLRKIGSNAFLNTWVTNIVLGASTTLTVESNSFAGVNASNGVHVVTFTHLPPTNRKSIDNILLNNNLTRRDTMMYIPLAKRAAWASYFTPIASVTDETIAAKARALDADGVWISEAGVYKAYVKYVGLSLKGMAIIIR